MNKIISIFLSIYFVGMIFASIGINKVNIGSPNNTTALNNPISVNNTPPQALLQEQYAYNQLSTSEKELYDQLKDAIFAYDWTITNGISKYSVEQIQRVNEYIMIDHPEIFWAAENGTVYTSEVGGVKSVTEYKIRYIMPQSQKDELLIKLDNIINDFLMTVNHSLGEYYKLLAVYEFIINRTEYDTNVADKITAGVDDDATLLSQNILSVLLSRRSVCAGYARTTQYLLHKMNMFCTYVSGTAKTQDGGHAWNLVRINGDYYLLDTTWGDPVSQNAKNKLTYNYFCLTTREFNKTHTPDDTIKLPLCVATKCNYFVYNKLLLNKYDLSQIEKILEKAVLGRKEEAYFKFSDLKTAQNANQSLFDVSKDVFSVLENISSRYKYFDKTSLSHSFDENNGVVSIGLKYN
jgi:hypothetical protein